MIHIMACRNPYVEENLETGIQQILFRIKSSSVLHTIKTKNFCTSLKNCHCGGIFPGQTDEIYSSLSSTHFFGFIWEKKHNDFEIQFRSFGFTPYGS